MNTIIMLLTIAASILTALTLPLGIALFISIIGFAVLTVNAQGY